MICPSFMSAIKSTVCLLKLITHTHCEKWKFILGSNRSLFCLVAHENNINLCENRCYYRLTICWCSICKSTCPRIQQPSGPNTLLYCTNNVSRRSTILTQWRCLSTIFRPCVYTHTNYSTFCFFFYNETSNNVNDLCI